MKRRRNRPKHPAYGARNGNAVLSPVKVARARRMRACGGTWIEIGDALGCNESTVRRAVKGQTWRITA